MAKYATVAIDSLSELGRLFFSKDLGKHAGEMEKIRQLNNWPGTTERLNILVRRLKDFKHKDTEIVIIAHEQVERFYAKGSGMDKNQEAPYAVKGLPDIPGKQTPEEVIRAADNVFRVRNINNVPTWVAIPESFGGDAAWVVKDRFGAPRLNRGYLPADYAALRKLAEADPAVKLDWDPPYVWIIYGTSGLGKTRSLRSFPKPLLILDVDRGTDSIKTDIKEGEIEVKQYRSEDVDDYAKLLTDLEGAFK